jgi:guanylate kinase
LEILTRFKGIRSVDPGECPFQSPGCSFFMSDVISFDRTHSNPLLIVVSGPSGVGKDSVIQALKRRELPMHVVVTSTNRKPRPNEVNGVDYYFISTAQFEEMIRCDELIEHAIVYGDYKGIPKAQIRDAFATGKDVILRVDVQGAARLRQLFPEAVLIFLMPANMDEWIRRLEDRHSETEESLRRRITTAKGELEHLDEFDYVVVNADCRLENAVDEIVSIVSAEHHRVHPRKISV